MHHIVCALWILGISCCVVIAQERQGNRPNIHVGVGVLVNGREDTAEAGAVAYRVQSVLRGRLPTNEVIEVSFFVGTSPASGFPHKAILVMHQFGYEYETEQHVEDHVASMAELGVALSTRTYQALGGDAYRGIMEDTERNRHTIVGKTLESLSSSPRSQWLSERRAIEIADTCVRKHGVSLAVEARYTVRRYCYGWLVKCSILNADGSQDVGNYCFVRVGDDGGVKEFMAGY